MLLLLLPGTTGAREGACAARAGEVPAPKAGRLGRLLVLGRALRRLCEQRRIESGRELGHLERRAG